MPDLSDDGQPIERPARPSDHFKKPFPNELAAAAANGGKAPPDLSLIVKARPGGPDYVYSLLTGYVPFDKLTPAQIKEFSVTKDDNFNTYFAAGAHKIAMPPPLADDKVTYVDGTKATLDQEARDIVEFLAWASSRISGAQPHRHPRHPLPAGDGGSDVRPEAPGVGRQALSVGSADRQKPRLTPRLFV